MLDCYREAYLDTPYVEFYSHPSHNKVSHTTPHKHNNNAQAPTFSQYAISCMTLSIMALLLPYGLVNSTPVWCSSVSGSDFGGPYTVELPLNIKLNTFALFIVCKGDCYYYYYYFILS